MSHENQRQRASRIRNSLSKVRLVKANFGFGTLAQRRYFIFINRLRESASARENTLMSSSARVSTSAP